jgi:hypothetical protein
MFADTVLRRGWPFLSTTLQNDSKSPYIRIKYLRHLPAPFVRWQFQGHWIGRCGTVAWPPRSPDLNTLDFDMRGHLRTTVLYQMKIQNTSHLKEHNRDACVLITPDVFKCVRLEREKRIRLFYQYNGAPIEQVL